MKRKVGSRGEVIIAKDIRDRLGIEPGWVALQRLVDDHVEIHFLPPEHNRSLRGALSQYTTVRIPGDEALEQAIEDSWDMAILEDPEWSEEWKRIQGVRRSDSAEPGTDTDLRKG